MHTFLTEYFDDTGCHDGDSILADSWEEAEAEAVLRGLSIYGLFVSEEEVIGSMLDWVRGLAEAVKVE